MLIRKFRSGKRILHFALSVHDVLVLTKSTSHSPFVMNVFPKFDTKKVEVSGDTNKKKLPASLPAKFQIDTKKAGKADINVTIKVGLHMNVIHCRQLSVIHVKSFCTESTR